MFRQILRNTGTNTTILPFVSVSSEFVLHSDLFRFLHIQHRKRIVLNQLVPTRDLGIPYIVFETIGNYIWDHVKR